MKHFNDVCLYSKICLNKNEDVCVLNYKFSGLTVLN